MILVFDLDGTLVEPWYGLNFPDFYKDDTDAVLRSIESNTYGYVKPLPYASYFLNDCKAYFENPVFYVLTTSMNGNEYIDKVNYVNKVFPDIVHVYGVNKDEDKLAVLQYLADRNEVMYFDDTISTLCKAEQLKTQYGLLCFHSTSMIMRSPKELDESFRLCKH